MIRIRLNALLIVSFAILVMACKKDNDAPVVDNETYEVAPNFTNNAYGSNENAHLIMRSSSAAGDRLFLFIGGTWSKPKNYEVICDYIRNAGYHVISLSYPNNIPAAPLGSSENPEVYSQYRQEICFGTPVSVDVDVDSLNSINQRFVNLLNYLVEKHTGEGWENFLESVTPVWSKITISGHSQGSGHAGYIAKQFAVDRVVMFAGPNDYQTATATPGDWLSDGSATALSDYFALLHAEDDVASYSNQVKNLRAMDILGDSDTTIRIETQESPSFGGYRAYHTGIDVISTHGSVASSKWHMSSFWDYLFDI